ncbi:hypothetical protein AMTR_s00064p00195450 [Amborella trichopoda]|uniref:Uncharacterized protein n=1 Tax=Amborella trichopoda TaxID=13333 RepID=U5DC74_AMBTC|nr:hypothetical protein AMTR_s00064p00195450 [Amborella trichopoda]
MIEALRGIPISPRRDEGSSFSAPPSTSTPEVAEEVEPEEDELQKAKGKAPMVGDKPLEVVNVSLAGSLSIPLLTHAEVIASIIATLKSLPWETLCRPLPPLSIDGQAEPTSKSKPSFLGVPIVFNSGGEVVLSTTVDVEFHKTDATSDVLSTLADTAGDLVGSMIKDPQMVSGFQQ